MKNIKYIALITLLVVLGSCGEGSPKGYYVIAGFGYDQIHLVLKEDGTCSNGQGSISGNRKEGTWTKTEDDGFVIQGMGIGMDGKWKISPYSIEKGDDLNDTYISFISPGGTAYTRHTIE